jgi:hypothetical protein
MGVAGVLRTRIRALVVPAAGVLALGVPATATADVVADWQMNEGKGASVLIDSENDYNGTIGNKVTTGVDLGGGATGHFYPGPEWGYDPGRLSTIPDAWGGSTSDLDPGTQPYAVTVRFKTTAHHPNIVQKGQSGMSGGFWKFVLKNGWPRCHFRDGNGRTKAIGFVKMGSEYKADDGDWHVIRCERLANGVKVSMDGWASKFISGSIGSVDNKRPFLIGGKLDCASADVGCDYVRGQIDYVKLEKG